MGSQLIGRAFLNVRDTFSNGRKISTNTPQGWRLTLKTLSDSPTHQKSSNYAQTNPALEENGKFIQNCTISKHSTLDTWRSWGTFFLTSNSLEQTGVRGAYPTRSPVLLIPAPGGEQAKKEPLESASSSQLFHSRKMSPCLLMHLSLLPSRGKELRRPCASREGVNF